MSLLIFILLVLAAAATGGIFKPDAWYRRLDKPAWTPPDWVFPLVWLAVYTMIAISGWLIWNVGEGFSSPLIWLWAGQLLLNAAWSWLFFGRKNMRAALVDVVALIVVVIAYIVLAMDVKMTAAMLFVPYAIWGTFAACLNADIVRRNPDAATA